jgi:tetratricopeptide (TPR) repeat protein
MRPYTIRKQSGKRCFAVLTIAMLLILLFSGLVVGASSPTYEYEEKNHEAEQKKYLTKLKQDKKKVELAVRNTKVLIDRSRGKPYLPEIYLRLAELYIEKSRIVYFIRKTIHKDSESSLDQLEANMLKNQAIEIYKRILDNFPDFEYRDKVHFFMAHEYRELGKTDEMIVHYRKIIKGYPKSDYVPESYLLLGDYFIGKQDVETAKRQYQAVLKYDNSPAIAIARYKLAWCLINLADYKKAIKLFEEAVKSTVTAKDIDIDTYKRVDVRMESLVDMAYCYPEVYKNSKPEEALNYFQDYSWSRQSYSIVLEKLAYRYFIKKRWHNAAHLYRELAELRQDPEDLLEYTRNIFECAQAIGKFQAADRDVALIIKALKKQRYSVYIDEKEKAKTIKIMNSMPVTL